MPNSFRSKTAWLTLLPIAILVGDTYNLWNIIGMPKTTFVQLVGLLSLALTAFGIFKDHGTTK